MNKKEFIKELNCVLYYRPEKIINSINVKKNISKLYKSNADIVNKVFTQNAENKKEIIKYLKNNNTKYDIEIFEEIKNMTIFNKKNIDGFLSKFNFKASFYLKVGDTIDGIDKYYNLNKYQIHDMSKNYNDGSFDLITCFNELFKYETPETLLNELYRLLKPGGLLIIKDHNIDEPDEYLDLLYDYKKYIENTQYNLYFKSKEQLSRVFKNIGFIEQSNPIIRKNNPKNPFNFYMMAFTKNAPPRRLQKFFRLLEKDFPREKYYQRKKEHRNYIHWGQRKLLLTEIEFLTEFYNKFDTDGAYIEVIYAGAAPCTHLPFIQKLFPGVKFKLYDPREFNKDLEGVEIYNEYFTTKTAELIKEQFNKIENKKFLLFISDIRTADAETMVQDEIETRVKADHILQKECYEIMNPDFTMLKFRLPWDDEITEYLDGDIYIQPYAPLSSTETRLFVKHHAGLKLYDNRAYEEQMFYFNKYMRPAEYTTKLNITGLNNNYDTTAEIEILYNYFTMKNIEINILDVMLEINKVLSKTRTLIGPQPLNPSKKKIIDEYIARGLAPKDINYTTADYSLYILPHI